jgi:hypothetical protein
MIDNTTVAMNVTRCAIPLSASAPLPSTVQGGYTSQVARIQSQLIASWVGEGETTANSLPNSPHRSTDVGRVSKLVQ